MAIKKTTLLLPVETQIRELDSRLLLACVAANRGFDSIIGPRRQVESRVNSCPRNIFVSKDMRAGNGKLIQIIDKLGHVSVAWDEEALIPFEPELYYKERMAPKAVNYVAHMFAWGPANAELWHKFPKLPADKPIHITGNPRGDLLRVEMHAFYDELVRKIREAYGDFVLINTNFSAVNAFSPIHNLLLETKAANKEKILGRTAKGMSRKYAEGYNAHIQAIFASFRQLIPLIEKAFPDLIVVVRPHPDENFQVYRNIAAKCQRVKVTNEGNVVPWLMAARALIHNGCTTGVEAYAVGLPTVAYRKIVNKYYDEIFNLPNSLSHQCFSFEELREKLAKILAGELGKANGKEPQTLFEHHVAAQEGPLASERIVNVLETILQDPASLPQPTVGARLEGWCRATERRFLKKVKSYLPRASFSPKLQRYLYPGISPEELRDRVGRFQRLLDQAGELKVEPIGKQVYRIGV
jgi:surface carbohydrate biosynthesis protein